MQLLLLFNGVQTLQTHLLYMGVLGTQGRGKNTRKHEGIYWNTATAITDIYYVVLLKTLGSQLECQIKACGFE